VAGSSQSQLRGQSRSRPGAQPPPHAAQGPGLLPTLGAGSGLTRLPGLGKGGSACISLVVKRAVSESGMELLPRDGARGVEGAQ